MRAKCIVRRKTARQRIVSDWVHTNSMTKLSATTAILAALTCAAGAVYWARGLGSSARVSRKSQPAEVSAMPAILEKTAVGDPSPPAKPVDNADRSAPREQPTPLRAGEVLEFAADVAKLSKLANLRLPLGELRISSGSRPV